jgi:hypothetical protein
MSTFRNASVLALLMTPACGEDGPPADEQILPPPPDGQGVQLNMSASIGPGVEGEWCKFVVGSDDDLWIVGDEVRFTEGSHHFLLYETPYDDIPTENDFGVRVGTDGVFDCTGGATDGWSVTRVIGGSQNGDGESIVHFPEGVAMHVRAGAVLMMNAHYINATTDTLRPQVAINVLTRPGETIDTEGDVLFLYNPFIRVDAQGTGRARYRCLVHDDITVVSLQSHMHARGVGYRAGIAGEAPVYENEHWENVPVSTFPEGLPVAGGTWLDYTCDYENAESRVVYQGPRTTDEMCMLIGAYYPADERTSNCRDASGDLGGEWVGNGTATCAATWQCLQSAFVRLDLVEAVTDCVLAADPGVSREVSEALRCYANSSNPDTQCAAAVAACEAL